MREARCVSSNRQKQAIKVQEIMSPGNNLRHADFRNKETERKYMGRRMMLWIKGYEMCK